MHFDCQTTPEWQVGAYIIECSLVVPTEDFAGLIDASRLELPQLLVLPSQWRPGSVTIGGVPAALTPRTWALLSRMARHPDEIISAMEFVAGLVIESDRVDVSRIVRTLRKNLGGALEDQSAHERISMAVNCAGDDRNATTAVLIESVRGKGYRLNLAPGLIAFD
ncbi:MAG: DNA-binding winged helix-turn-helix (wHTH) protein [Bradymonadia bacterium]|jgi:DNA-binding winged helix-turn-helix (wHTH) protein